jgi:hypothetical protein
LAGLLLVLAFILPDGTDDARRPSPVKVSRTSYACPAGSGVTIAAGQVKPGRSSTARTLPGRAAVDALSDATRWRRAEVDADGLLVDQRGRGSGAVGFFAHRPRKRDGGGLVVGSCPATVDDSWFVGLGSGGKHLSTLVLTNMSASPAVADLSFWGAQGKINAIDAEGVVVDPYTVRRVDLRSLAAGEAELTARVERRRGALTVAAIDASTAVFRGTESVQPSRPPRREQLVPGVPAGSRGRSLILLNPSSSTARVAVAVIGARGRIAPKGLESVKLGAGELKVVEVPRSAGTDRAALRLRSDQPILAAVRVAPGVRDRAMIEAVGPLDGSAVVPVDLGGGIGAPELVLTAPGHQGSVRLVAYDDRMRRTASNRVEIGAGTTKGVDLGSTKVLDAEEIAYVVVRADGDVAGAVTYRRDQAIASLALTGAPVTVLGPQVRTVG